MYLSKDDSHSLELTANRIRQSIIEMLFEAKSGHTAGSLGMADIFTALYFYILKHRPNDPKWDKRDMVVLSNGHICPVYYATLAHAGYFPLDELLTLRKFGSRLQGHPHREFLNILETSSGPLGSGLSQSVGMALALKMDEGESSKRYVYCLMSDGELQEGNTWEGAMLAGKEKLHNLIVFIDRNNIQIDGYTENVMPLEPLKDKWLAWNWHVLEIDGHRMQDIVSAVEKAKSVKNKPTVIIAHTIPGKGVSEFENKYEWHGKPPNSEEAKQALKSLRSLRSMGGHLDYD